MDAVYGPAGDTDASEAYLFECDDERLFAVSLDRSGANIPRTLCAEGWRLRQAFALGVRETVPFPVAPEPILRGLRNSGFYIWRTGSNPKGTTQ